jgi:succinoglycan biosynthesis protein ExoO
MVFVGSNTAPNVVGLNWFVSEVWPRVAASRPNATLKIAGSVARALSNLPAKVECLGVVPDLKPVYEAAGVVVSPLTVGSGLKIKLVEAMGEGKAIVATSVSVQGIAGEVSGAVLVEDDPAAFAGALVALLGDRARRAELGRASLAIARSHFAAGACYGALPGHLFPDPPSPTPVRAGASPHGVPGLSSSLDARL